jgi:hypothetical protein
MRSASSATRTGKPGNGDVTAAQAKSACVKRQRYFDILDRSIETRSTSPVPQKESSRANQPGFVVFWLFFSLQRLRESSQSSSALSLPVSNYTMRVSRFVRSSGPIVCVCFVAFFLSSSPAGAKAVRAPATFSERVRTFLQGSDLPVLFIGKLSWTNPNYLPCTIQNMRSTTWSVSRVLYGFDPGSKIDILFGSCGTVETQFKSQDEMLVIAYPGFRNSWVGMKESVVPATDANIRIARRVMDDYLRSQIRAIHRPHSDGTPRPILLFTGTIIDPGPPRGDQPCPATVPPTFPVKFKIEQQIRGDLTEKEVTVQFPGCGPLRSPVFQTGRQVIVFALMIEPAPPRFFRAGVLLPPSQRAQVEAALKAVESSFPPHN